MTVWFLWVVGLLVGLATLATVVVIGGELYARWKYEHRRTQAHHQSQAGAIPATPTGAARAGEGARVIQETSTEEIVAYRRWRYVDQEACVPSDFMDQPLPIGRRLYSVVFWWEWESPTLRADECPALNTGHGIYAMRTLELLDEHFSGGYLGSPYPAIEGEVALSGTVIEGEYGYRAEQATIRRLWFLWNPLPDEQMPGLIAEFEARYQCDVSWNPANQEAA